MSLIYASGATCPKLEFFSDRVEITSMGGHPYGVTANDFFSGCSVPRNKEIMRVFRDLEIVEHLGSGIPRILEAYGKDVFEIRDSYIRIVFRKFESGPSQDQVTTQVKHILEALRNGPLPRAVLQESTELKNREHFRKEYLEPLVNDGFIESTIPDKPTSRLQQYRLTEKGRHSLDPTHKQ